MSRLVCFIDNDGQTATCINEDVDCVNCPHNDDAHKKWIEEINQKPRNTWSEFKHDSDKKSDNGSESHLLNGIKNHELDISLNFVDQDIIITGTASKNGIQVFGVTRCFDDDLGCEDKDCLKCPYIDKSKQEAIFNKYEMTVVEILKDAYKKIEAMR